MLLTQKFPGSISLEETWCRNLPADKFLDIMTVIVERILTTATYSAAVIRSAHYIIRQFESLINK